MRNVYRVYAYYLGKRYIVEDFDFESDALEYCGSRDWQLINRRGKCFLLGVEKMPKTINVLPKVKEACASILFVSGMLATIAAGTSDRFFEIIACGVAGLVLMIAGAKILEG